MNQQQNSTCTLPQMNTEHYQHLLEQCVHCGLCLETCPTYSVLGTEMDSPRGRIALMRAVVEGRVGQDIFLDTFARHITLCLECRACETACPSGVQYGKLIEGTRCALEATREPGVIERVVRWAGLTQLMPHTTWLKAMARVFALYETLGLQWLIRTVNILPRQLQTMEAILPPIATRYTDSARIYPAIGTQNGMVTFFHGCIQEAFLAPINAATIRVLQRNGYEVRVPQPQTCCGAAQWHTGDEATARKLARQNIDTFLSQPSDAIINNAGGCGLTLKEYPDLLHNDPAYAQKARDFAAKVQDFSEFLYDHLHTPPQGNLQTRATYVDSCHLRHGQHIIHQPRDLLRRIQGLDLVELNEPDQCCGSAGIYNIMQPDLSSAVLKAKLDDIASTGADLVVTSNTGCHMQLVAGVRQAGLNARVMHIAEVLDLAYQQELEQRPTRPSLKPEQPSPRPLFTPPRSPTHWLDWLARQEGQLASESNALDTLKALLEPGQVRDDPATLVTYELDAGIDRGHPLGVVFPYSTDDVQAVVRWAVEHDLPLIARGAGTGLAGGAVAEHGGLLLVFSHMKALLELDETGRSAVVQPGIINQTLDETVKARGLYFPPDPASGRAATLGGNIGANAGGPHCFKYGVTTNYVLGLDVVLADGNHVALGGRALDYPELDLMGILTGSEGTLGIITAATVSLRRHPPAVKTLMAAFQSVEQAGEAVSAVIARGLVPATMEMMDHRIMQSIEAYAHPGLPIDAGAALIVEADGYPGSVEPQIEEIVKVLQEYGGYDLRIAETEAQREKIWLARKSAGGSLAQIVSDHITIDGTVPRSCVAQTLTRINQICETLDLTVAHVFHAGDGNMHPLILITDPDNPEFMARVKEAGRQISAYCVEQGGTITGEHGVGVEKRDFMPLMYTEDELSVMKEVKTVFDPHTHLNPGKIFPPEPQRNREQSPPQSQENLHKKYTPHDAQEAADFIRAMTHQRRPIHVQGGGTKSQLFPKNGLHLSTQNLNGIQTYTLDDLYVTVDAGMPLADLQAELAKNDVWVPLSSPWNASTVGGIVASNFNAPLRMRYGSIRDLVLAVTAILPDGRLVRAGRPVMKDVAGYDLTKLFVGSYGTLGLISDVTLKLAPRPRVRITYSIPVDNIHRGLAWGQALLRVALVSSAVLLCYHCESPAVDTPYALIYTAEGLPEDVEAELQEVRACLNTLGAPHPVESNTPGSALWATWMSQPQRENTLLLRAGVAPKDLRALIAMNFASVLEQGAFMADFASGFCYARGPQKLITLRKAAQNLGGYAVLLNANIQNGDMLDIWGYTPTSLDLMRKLKTHWDPTHIFNPDTFIV